MSQRDSGSATASAAPYSATDPVQKSALKRRRSSKSNGDAAHTSQYPAPPGSEPAVNDIGEDGHFYYCTTCGLGDKKLLICEGCVFELYVSGWNRVDARQSSSADALGCSTGRIATRGVAQQALRTTAPSATLSEWAGSVSNSRALVCMRARILPRVPIVQTNGECREGQQVSPSRQCARRSASLPRRPRRKAAACMLLPPSVLLQKRGTWPACAAA